MSAELDAARTRTLTEAELVRAYELCAQVCESASATVAGGYLGQLRDLLTGVPAPAATNHPTYGVSPGALMVVEAPAGNTAATRVTCGCPDCLTAETTSGYSAAELSRRSVVRHRAKLAAENRQLHSRIDDLERDRTRRTGQ